MQIEVRDHQLESLAIIQTFPKRFQEARHKSFRMLRY